MPMLQIKTALNPQFMENKQYKLHSKVNGDFNAIFNKRQKGDGDVVHYIFKHGVGGYKISVTNVELLVKDVVVE